ncbi:maleylpyruvate isomerase N-terminal domain-containing protein [Cellulomonas palmilytica]|uniref:maleylpyruvate isomerase N-terminal domain-containing protein n=1 Tax=Cellulomonas palmilytica TaxID=2608402 RepID=UPI001F3D846C|nr:maleylpyruvate isomerase N-terminal domain-containing protein [Cellulomonas palmilytica]UJP40892.1 maleylpyruvate isomerase N-terminal domain-containing protein [Cellulomonas palmilytica]
MTATLAEATTALHDQWERLRAWVVDVVDDAAGSGVGDAPSVLEGWTVTELVAHVGRAMDALAACTPLPAGTVPLTLAEYLGTYAGRAADIADTTRELAAQVADDPVAWIDARAAAAFATLSSHGGTDGVVQARRGPVRLSTMTVSRVVELVVHADDLFASVHRVPGAGAGPDPVEPGALRLVADELLAIVVARGGWDLEVTDPRRWVRLAAGREPYDVDALAVALAPRWTGDSLPDLGRMLPLL